MRIMVLRYGPSQSGRAIARNLNARLIKLEGSRYRPREGDVVVNWGSSANVNLSPAFVVNPPGAVRQASNKLTALVKMYEAGVRTVPFTCRIAEAQEWIRDGNKVVARTQLRGHSGSGIVMVGRGTGNVMPEAPLYTKYVKKTKEYRIHVNQRGSYFIQQKRRRRDTPDSQVNWQVRNWDNGFVYAVHNVEWPGDMAVSMAVTAIRSLGLDYGAVDMGWHNDTGLSVYEVNTAPGLTGVSTAPQIARLIREEVFNGDDS